jgi:hypothetical protein
MLYELQNCFLQSIQSAADNQFLKYIRPNQVMSPARQLEIYRSSIIGRFQKALKAIYPICEQLVGSEFFMAMASEFIATTQSHSPDLNDYGSDFADFIAAFAPAQALPYLADTARLEWAWHQITGAPDQTSFDHQGLVACYEEQADRIIFTLPKRASLLASPYPVHQIWESNQKHFQGEQAITLVANQQYYFFIWRDGTDLRIDPLNEREWFLLNLFSQGIPLAVVCERTEHQFPTVDVAALLSAWVVHGWIGGFMVV